MSLKYLLNVMLEYEENLHAFVEKYLGLDFSMTYNIFRKFHFIKK
ncbi:hypothetical protein SAMN02745190_02416 [Schwartzia succinivorans DSM 10502]|jgi:hypothetical protein|uniref:Uncharacterized protein n=1 Tax=Schwartzia succinivorans DSM 10502 TaxID=1123243 RepID=A0A1M5ASQ9_9FIRM|nr:hypothetical protein SAMN02745190_02416 [Schwartzia succinivorans DSM 10502]